MISRLPAARSRRCDESFASGAGGGQVPPVERLPPKMLELPATSSPRLPPVALAPASVVPPKELSPMLLPALPAKLSDKLPLVEIEPPWPGVPPAFVPPNSTITGGMGWPRPPRPIGGG